MPPKFFGDQRGTIGVLSALTIVAVIGFSALAVEFGHGLLQREEDQRVADLAAYGGALVYNSSSGSTDAATAAAANVARLNGLPAGAAASLLVNSPTNDGNQAMRVTVTTKVPLLLARVLTQQTTLPISATAFAEIKTSAPGCVIALNGGGTGVTVSGGATVTADNCAVASNETVTLTGGTTITTKVVDYGTTAPSVGGGSVIDPPAGTPSVRYSKTATPDPMSGNTEVASATGRLGTVSSIKSPPGPSGSGGIAVAFGYGKATGLPPGCTDSFSSPIHTLTCSGGGTFTFGSISLSGGITVNFNTGGSSAATYNFNGSVSNSGTALTFGPGTYNITQGLTTGGGTTTTFGAGTFVIGKLTGSCNSATGYSICNTGTSLIFSGPSTFVLAGGIYNGGGETLTLGSSGTTTNSYNIGAAGDGNSLYVGGGATTTLYDATGTSDLFQTAGNIASSGGSCLWIPAAAEHDVNGYISLTGGTTLGAGVYTVTDYAAFGASSGGDVTCAGSSVGVSGSGVTLVLGGAKTVSCGSTAGTAFCVGSGFNHVTLTAPSSGSTENLVVIGPTSSGNTAGASFVEGSTNTTLSGAFYFPNGPVGLSGAATISDAGGCLELIGSQVALAGGSAAASSCAGLGGSGSTGGSVALVR